MPDTSRISYWLPITQFLTAIGFLLALVLLAHLLRSKRSPASTISWLLVIVLLPYVGVPLYLMLGGRKMRRMASRKEMVYSPEDVSREGEFGAGTERILRSFGVPPATKGNRIELLTEGVEAYRELLRIIDSARLTLHMTTYILATDEVGEAVVALLAAKAREGVQVRVLLDALGSWRTSWRFLAPLMEAGGKVSFFMPVWHLPFRGRTNLRNHRKIVVADGRVALAGGMNVAVEYMGSRADPKRWKDLSLVVEGPASADLDDVFWSDWSFATGERLPEGLPRALAEENSGDAIAQVVASGPDVAGDPLYESLVALLFAARERIWVVTPYFVPDEILARALELAARRGVEVRLVIPNRSNHVTADLARVGYLRPIHEAGGRIFRYRPTMVHAKVIVVDNELAVVGSANMDMRSLFLNYEVALFLYGSGQIKATQVWVESLLSECRPGLSRQNWWLQLVENVVRLLSPLL